MEIVRARKAAMVDEVVELHVGEFVGTRAELICGYGKFIGLKTLEVNGRVLTGDVVIIGTGSRAVVNSSIPGQQAVKPLTHVEILSSPNYPRGEIRTEKELVFSLIGNLMYESSDEYLC